MRQKPMTVGEMIAALQQQPAKLPLAWVNDGTVGYFYAEDQTDMAPDDGHVHIQCGGCPEP